MRDFPMGNFGLIFATIVTVGNVIGLLALAVWGLIAGALWLADKVG